MIWQFANYAALNTMFEFKDIIIVLPLKNFDGWVLVSDIYMMNVDFAYQGNFTYRDPSPM